MIVYRVSPGGHVDRVIEAPVAARRKPGDLPVPGGHPGRCGAIARGMTPNDSSSGGVVSPPAARAGRRVGAGRGLGRLWSWPVPRCRSPGRLRPVRRVGAVPLAAPAHDTSPSARSRPHCHPQPRIPRPARALRPSLMGRPASGVTRWQAFPRPPAPESRFRARRAGRVPPSRCWRRPGPAAGAGRRWTCPSPGPLRPGGRRSLRGPAHWAGGPAPLARWPLPVAA
jgi:hypothetical protein